MQLLKRKFTVQQYHRMMESGILCEDERVELIRGEIVEMAPIGERHAAYIRRLNPLFAEKLSQRVLVDIQNPVKLNDASEPQPDVALLRPRPDFYESRHPQAEDIFLIVEVADTTTQSDREIKIPLYAEGGIPEVWLVNIREQCLEVYRTPSAEGYQVVKKLQRGQKISLQAFPDVEIAVDEILGLQK